MACKEPRARNFYLDPGPRITLPVRGMSKPHLRGLNHDRTRSHAQNVRKCLHRKGHPNMHADPYERPKVVACQGEFPRNCNLGVNFCQYTGLLPPFPTPPDAPVQLHRTCHSLRLQDKMGTQTEREYPTSRCGCLGICLVPGGYRKIKRQRPGSLLLSPTMSYCQKWCPSAPHAAALSWFDGLMPLMKSTP